MSNGAEITQAVVAALALVVLCKYAYDTRTLAKAATEQVEVMQRPIIAIRLDHRDSKFRFSNVGTAVALNISWQRQDDTRGLMHMHLEYMKLTEQELYYADFLSVLMYQRKVGWIDYESPSGRAYRTEVELIKNGDGDGKTVVRLKFRDRAKYTDGLLRRMQCRIKKWF
jgi:hypothetical protein